MRESLFRPDPARGLILQRGGRYVFQRLATAEGRMRGIGLLLLVACSSPRANVKAPASAPVAPVQTRSVPSPTQTPDGIIEESENGTRIDDSELGLKINFPIGPVKLNSS